MARAVGIELVLNDINFVLLELIGQGGLGSVYKAMRKSQAASLVVGRCEQLQSGMYVCVCVFVGWFVVGIASLLLAFQSY